MTTRYGREDYCTAVDELAQLCAIGELMRGMDGDTELTEFCVANIGALLSSLTAKSSEILSELAKDLPTGGAS